MITKPIFRGHKLSVAREKSRLPVFLDFSSGKFSGDSAFPGNINDIILSTSHTIDGAFLSPRNLPDLCSQNKEIWIHAGQSLDSIPECIQRNETGLPILHSGYLARSGVSGIVGSLLLGKSASDEADNIQTLAFLRSLSLEIGLPLAIDIYVSDPNETPRVILEIVELSIDLAVELGADIIIIPGGQYLSLENQIENITTLPMFIRQPIDQVEGNLSTVVPEIPLKNINGIVLTDLDRWDQLKVNPKMLDAWADSFHFLSNGE